MPTAESSHRSLEGTDLCFMLSHAAHVLNTELTVGLDALGLLPRAHCVLSTAMDAGLTQIQLADRCDLDKTTMVVTLDELERLGLAERHASPSDRRARIVVVTDAGRAMVDEGREVVSRIQADVLSSLPEHEREVFLSALTRLTSGRLASPLSCERAPRRRK